MLSWNEWEKLVKDSQKGDKNSLEILLEKSLPIINNVMKEKFKPDDDVNLHDVRQEVYLRIIDKLVTLRKPRAYVDWLKHLTKNYCVDTLKKKREILFNRIDDLKPYHQDKGMDNFNSIADRKGFMTDAVTLYQNQFNQLTEKGYQIKSKQKSAEIIKTIDALNIKKGQIITDDSKIYGLLHGLGQSLIDKQEYNYLDAEKKLREIINFTEERRLNTELRYIQAKSITELGHLKMNEGFVTGIYGAIYWYKRAEKNWRFLKDKPKELYVRQQIGVSNHIQGYDQKAIKTYNAILSEIGRKRIYKELKASVWRDQSNALLAMDAMRGSLKYAEKSLLITEDIGGITLSYTRLQMAKIYIKKRKYNKAYSMIIKCIDDTPRYRVLDHIKANIALFDLFIKTNQKDTALKLVPKIRNNCIDYLFHHQLQKLQIRLSKL